MRQIIRPQLSLGVVDIAAIPLDPFARDDLPRLLRGLQYLYQQPQVREEVFTILRDVVPLDAAGQPVSVDTGRPGMSQWQILVLGVLRLGLNADYDRIQELANNHLTIRQMLGHSDFADGQRWGVQTLKDNLRLFTPELLERINAVVITAGHALVKKSPDDGLAVRGDSFVVETDVHYPTDTNLLYDAVRQVIETSAGLCADAGLSDWRQHAYNVRCLKKAYRRTQQVKRSRAQDETKRAAREVEIRQAHEDYLALAESFLARARVTRLTLIAVHHGPAARFTALDDYVAHAVRQIDQVRRRVLHGERIPHEKRSSPFLSPIPSGSKKVRPGCRWNWACACW